MNISDQTFFPADRTRTDDLPATALADHLHPSVLEAKAPTFFVYKHFYTVLTISVSFYCAGGLKQFVNRLYKV
jgi:hypothetical protein